MLRTVVAYAHCATVITNAPCQLLERYLLHMLALLLCNGRAVAAAALRHTALWWTCWHRWWRQVRMWVWVRGVQPQLLVRMLGWQIHE